MTRALARRRLAEARMPKHAAIMRAGRHSTYFDEWNHRRDPMSARSSTWRVASRDPTHRQSKQGCQQADAHGQRANVGEQAVPAALGAHQAFPVGDGEVATDQQQRIAERAGQPWLPARGSKARPPPADD